MVLWTWQAFFDLQLARLAYFVGILLPLEDFLITLKSFTGMCDKTDQRTE